MSEAGSPSPYAPPKAVVSDAPPSGEAPERPPEMERAVLLLWIYFGVTIASAVWNLVRPMPIQRQATFAATLVMMAVGYLFVVWVYRAIGKGRNWARILYIIFTVFSLLGLAYTLMLNTTLHFGAVRIVFAVVGTVMHGYIAYLLLTAPARAWFAEMKEY